MTDEPTDPRTSDLPHAMGNPARTAFAVAGIFTLADAARWTERDLLALHGVGPKALRVLREELATRGLALRSDG